MKITGMCYMASSYDAMRHYILKTTTKQKYVLGKLIISFSGDDTSICSVLIVVLYFLVR